MPRFIKADDLAIKFRMLAEDPWNKDTGTTWSNAYEECADNVDEFPTADVVSKEQYDILLEHANILAKEMRKYQTADVMERKRGKWIRESLISNYPYKCTACKKYSFARYDFCPNCGSDNREEAEDAEISN